MILTVSFMSNIIGAIGIVLYMAAPFLENSKKALIYRLVAELLFGIMFFYIGCLAGVAYYGIMLVSVLLEKQIEHNKYISLGFGIVGCVIVFILNNNGLPGRMLALSLILIYFPLNENKMLTTNAFIDVASSVILLYYSISIKSLAGVVFAILLVVAAFAGLISATRLAKAGGVQTAAAEEALYQLDKTKKRNFEKAIKKHK